VSSSFVWGVDVAVSHLEFAFADLDSDEIAVESLITRTEAREGERLGSIDRQVRTYAKQLAGRYRPHVVWVEQPAGKFIEPQLFYVVGVLQAALWDTLQCPVWTIPPGAWKKLSAGFGNASKAQVSAWCERQRYSFDGQDQADALAIAFAGRRMVQTASWEGVAA
jgi:Holliday junction resolvasome RuvABC endonuclease subunit